MGAQFHMSAMVESDVQLEEIETPTFPVPLCDEEDESIARAHKPEDLESSDDDVEAHGGGGFNQPT